MDLATFEQTAFAYWASIPAHFREGVTAFIVEPGTFRKEEFEEGWVYGLCEPDEAVLALPEAPVCSIIRIFYGSFVHIAAMTEGFDWEEELWETVYHELQHHLEWRAGVDHLGHEDDLQDENERRLMGAPFTPDYHRLGLALGRGVYLADHDLFVEVDVDDRAWDGLATEALEASWAGARLIAAPVPAELLDDSTILYLPAQLEHLEETGPARMPFRDAVIVARRRTRRWWWPFG